MTAEQIDNQSAISRARALTISLLEELEAMDRHGNALHAIGEVMAGMDDSAASNRIEEVWRQVTSLPGRIDAIHKLTETMQMLGMTGKDGQ